MVLRTGGGPLGSPDDAQAIVGNEGLELSQEGRQLVVRTGVESDQRDYDVQDLSITDREDVVVANPDSIGSTSELSGALESDQGEPFRLMVVWQASDNETELYRQDYGSDTVFEFPTITVKSDHAAVLVTDESAAGTGNTITGTLNFH